MKQRRFTLTLKPFFYFFLTALAAMQTLPAHAEKRIELSQAEFGNEFFRGKENQGVDVSRFSKANPVSPGTYRADVYANGSWVGRMDVVFRQTSDKDGVFPCFNQSILEAIGVDLSKLSEEALAILRNAKDGTCVALGDMVPDAGSTFDSGDLRLDVSVPQLFIRRSARGYVNPELWDKGVNAALLSYNFNAFRTTNGAVSNTSYYLGLNGGVNLGDWRLRNTGSLSRQSGGATSYQNIATYAQRDVVSLKSQMVVGDAYTSGQLFDSISFRGVRLATDERMLPDSQSGYAPVVRGVARTSAKVQVIQNGNVIYETTVAPGQFEITDLYPTGYGGNLRVVVTEADGSKNSFIVPYASVAQLLRPGTGRYEFIAGQTRNVGISAKTGFVQGTYQYGVGNDFTLFGGGVAAQSYLALLGGTAFNTPVGAMSLSMTQSHARVSDSDTRSGQSFKADYSKSLTETGTNFSLAAYRYSSSGYLRLQDMLVARQLAARGLNRSAQDRQRSQLQLIVNQSLGEKRGAFFISGGSQNYWNRAGSSTQYQAGYNNSWGSTSYSFSVQRQKDQLSGTTGTQYFASISFPLGRENNSPSLTTSLTRDNRNGTSLQSSLYGSAGDNNAFSYGATVARSPNSSSGSVNGQYRTAYANLGGNYGYTGGGGQQMSAQISGALVAHPGGVTLAQSLGDTIGIVEARNAEGAEINSTGVSVDRRGYAVVPFLTPYRNNEVIIDPKGVSTDVELALTSQRVAPHAGAVVMMKYPTVSGRSILIQAKMPNGDAVPFGAEVLDEQGSSVGMAGQAGQIFVRISGGDSGKITVRWGSESTSQCVIHYQLPAREQGDKGVVYDQISAVCEKPADLVKYKKEREIVGEGAKQPSSRGAS